MVDAVRAKKKRGKGQHRRHAVGKHDSDKRQWRGYREDRGGKEKNRTEKKIRNKDKRKRESNQSRQLQTKQ